ncbi:MAG: endonuclease domain-containing protein [Leptothrix ochracea]|uniref:endonuclease domain-containing protein n=1 Tax=Leptothrix ochracea TaxID=735331 RepID=UPI0034E2CF14
MIHTGMRDRARSLRQEATPFEQTFWSHVRSGRFSGWKFRRQQVIGPYIVDFVCPKAHLIVELDGAQHALHQPYDQARDAWLHAQGYRILRVWNPTWSQHPEAVLTQLWQMLTET